MGLLLQATFSLFGEVVMGQHFGLEAVACGVHSVGVGDPTVKCGPRSDGRRSTTVPNWVVFGPLRSNSLFFDKRGVRAGTSSPFWVVPSFAPTPPTTNRTAGNPCPSIKSGKGSPTSQLFAKFAHFRSFLAF